MSWLRLTHPRLLFSRWPVAVPLWLFMWRQAPRERWIEVHRLVRKVRPILLRTSRNCLPARDVWVRRRRSTFDRVCIWMRQPLRMPFVRPISLGLSFQLSFRSLRDAVTTDAFNYISSFDHDCVVVVREDLKRSEGHVAPLFFTTGDFVFVRMDRNIWSNMWFCIFQFWLFTLT